MPAEMYSFICLVLSVPHFLHFYSYYHLTEFVSSNSQNEGHPSSYRFRRPCSCCFSGTGADHNHELVSDLAGMYGLTIG